MNRKLFHQLECEWGLQLRQGFVASDGAADAEFAHAGLQGGALHAEEIGGAAGAGDAPLGLAQGAEDVLALGLFQGGDRR
jgi:hypothetical protein